VKPLSSQAIQNLLVPLIIALIAAFFGMFLPMRAPNTHNVVWDSLYGIGFYFAGLHRARTTRETGILLVVDCKSFQAHAVALYFLHFEAHPVGHVAANENRLRIRYHRSA
jgi:hypothetical protein